MQIKFHKIKHSWKNNENAMWENSSNFDEKIFEEIKQDYVYISSQKPNYKIINKKYVFFFYEEKKDKYDRKIVELVAFLSPKIRISNPDKVYNDIKYQTRVFNSELDILIETDEKMNINKLVYILPLIFIFIFSIYFYLQPSSKKNSPIIEEKEEFIHHDYSEFRVNWNKYIKEEKGIDSKYLLENSNKEYIYSELTKYLKINKYLDELNKIKELNYPYFMPVINWIEARNKIKYLELNNNMSEKEIYDYIAKTLNAEYFSKKVLLELIQINDLCFYYEKHKEEFFRKGLNSNIECKDIEKELIENKIDLN